MISEFLVSILASVGILQGGLIAIYLIFKKESTRSYSLLGIALLGLSLRMLKSVLGYHDLLNPVQASMLLSGILLTGPFLWFHFQSLTGHAIVLKKASVHLVPFIVFLLFTPFGSDFFHHNVGYWLTVTHLGGYLLFSVIQLIQIKEKASRPVHKWMIKIVLGISAVWTFYLLNLIEIKLHYLTGPIYYSFMVYWFTLLFLNRKAPISRYQTSTLSSKDSLDLYNSLRALFEQEEIYLHSGLSLESIAVTMNTSPRHISQVVNENTGDNFKALVNNYRIQKAKSLLVDEKYSGEKIATIAYESGYNNVTSFNLAFKRVTGLSPTQFKQPEHS